MSAAPVLVPTATGGRPAARLSLDPSVIAANTRVLGARTTGAVMAVVKADGFGHGAVEVATAALGAGATWLGVTSIEEALALRDAGLDAPVLSWLNPLDADWAGAVAADVEVAIPSREHLEALLGALREAPRATTGTPRVHLHLDTGMARDGAAPGEWPALVRAARRAELQGQLRVTGVMGHLGCAETPADPANARGRTRFAWGVAAARAAGLRPVHRHLAATAATLLDPLSHHTMSRIGAGLVGIDPTGDHGLRGALTLTAPLVGVRTVRGGTPVGYGHTWSAPGTTCLGLLPLGYADGLPRSASGKAEVLVRGRRARVVGRISMDMAVLDLGSPAEAGSVAAGEQVTVLGPGDAGEPTVRDWAGWSGLLEHEILTGLGPRPERVVVRRHALRSLA